MGMTALHPNPTPLARLRNAMLARQDVGQVAWGGEGACVSGVGDGRVKSMHCSNSTTGADSPSPHRLFWSMRRGTNDLGTLSGH